MVRILSLTKPKKAEKQPRKTTKKNNNFFTILMQGLRVFLKNIHVFLYKRRTLKGVGNALWTRGILGSLRRFLKTLSISLHKKRTFRGTWEHVCDFFKETPEEEVEVPKTWFKRNQYVIWDGIMLILVYFFLFSGLKMEWFLRDIIPIGGDVPYHYANYIDLKEILLPDFQISGWSDASFAGFQLFQSYPIFPFVLIYLLDLFIGSGVAFKAILMLGAVGLPLAVYWALLQTKVARPGPIFGAILSLAYLFHDDHFAFGGNLRSVFSGEFAHSLSILLLVLFCGFLYKAFENKKYIPLAIIMLALVGFSHPISFAVGIFLPLGFLLMPKGENEVGTPGFLERGSIAFRIILISGLLFCTWAIGFYVNKKYSGMGTPDIISNAYGWGLTFHYLIPKLLFPFAVLFLGNIIYYVFYWRKISALQIFFLWGTLISIGFFLFKFMGFAIRFLPLMYLFVMLFIACTMGKVYHETRREAVRIFITCLIIVSALFIFYFVDSNNLFQRYRGTSGFNFMGAEYREEWKSVRLTSEFLSENFDTQTRNTETPYPPRVFSHFKGDLFRVTSRASLYDSLFSSSFFTSQGIGASRKIDKQQISVEKFWNYMSLSNTEIIIATKKMAEYLDKPPYFSNVKTFGHYTVLQANNTSDSYVLPLKNQAYSISDLKAWKKASRKWFDDYSEKSPFIVYDPSGEQSIFKQYDPKKVDTIPYRDDCRVREFIQRETITIHTNCIGRPLLVKFAYHQNWQITGAKKVYLSTPAFMVVVPEKNKVVLHYGKRPYNFVAYACGILGIILLFSHAFLERIIISTYKKLSKKYEKIHHLLSLVVQKIKLPVIGNYILKRSVPCVMILILLVSIALVYTNKG